MKTWLKAMVIIVAIAGAALTAGEFLSPPLSCRIVAARLERVATIATSDLSTQAWRVLLNLRHEVLTSNTAADCRAIILAIGF